MVTRADVAKLAGVSPSTVSYVFSGERPIGLETKEKVFEAARQLDYVPNAYASNLAARDLRTIGIHLTVGQSGIDRTTAEYVMGMKERCDELGLMLLIPTSIGTEEATFRRFLRSKLLDGVIYMEVATDDWREEVVLSENYPAVALGSSGRTDGVAYVETDFVALGKMLVDESVKRGHARGLFLGRKSGCRSHLDRMLGGLREGFESQGQAKNMVIEQVFLPENFLAARQVIPYLQRSHDRPTVLIADNMPVAEAVIALAVDEGFELGADYSIVASGAQIGYTAETAFDLSEVSTDRVAMGRECVDLLDETYRAKDSSAVVENKIYKPRFIDRGSLQNAPGR